MDERLEWSWSHPVVLHSCINLVTMKYKLKSQYVKLNQLWPLTVNCPKVSCQSHPSGRLIIKFWKICFLCTYVNQMIIQQRFDVFASNSVFQIFLLMFFPLSSLTFWIFMNYLKYIIRYLNIAKHLLLTIIINQANSMSKLHRVSELYPYVPFGSKNSFGTKLKEILGRILF